MTAFTELILHVVTVKDDGYVMIILEVVNNNEVGVKII
jgi:hypothetical protein